MPRSVATRAHSCLLLHTHFRCQCLSHVSCARKIGFALRERPSFRVGQVCSLRKDQELVEGIYTQASDQFQPNGQPHAAQKVHRFVERQAARVAECSVCPPELVFNNITSVAKQYSPRLLFARDNGAQNLQQLVDDLLLTPTKRGLVRDLEEVADHLTSLAVQAAVGEADLLP